MDKPILVVCLFTFVINYIASLAFAVRIVGFKTQLWGISFAIFNIITIISRISNTLQAPMLAKYIEQQMEQGITQDISNFRNIISFASVGVLLGAMSIPTFARILERAANNYYHRNSLVRVFVSAFKPRAWAFYYNSITLPISAIVRMVKHTEGIPWKVIAINVVVSAIATTSVLACLYAGYLNPTLRATASSMNGLVNGMSVVLGLLFVDPYVAVFADEVNKGKRPLTDYYRYIFFMLLSQLVGTLAAQFTLVPLAYFIIWIINSKLF